MINNEKYQLRKHRCEHICSLMNQKLYDMAKLGTLKPMLVNKGVFNQLFDEHERSQFFIPLKSVIHFGTNFLNYKPDTISNLLNMAVEDALVSIRNQIDALIINSSSQVNWDITDGLRALAYYKDRTYDHSQMKSNSHGWNIISSMKHVQRNHHINKECQYYRWLTSISTFFDILSLLDDHITHKNFDTNYYIDQVPVFVAQQIRENLNSSGIYDGITTEKTVALLVDVRAFTWQIDWNRIRCVHYDSFACRTVLSDVDYSDVIMEVPFSFRIHPDHRSRDDIVILIHNIDVSQS